VGLLALAASQGSRVRGEESGNRGQELVAEAARRLQAEKALSAELRYRIDAYGHQLIGAGNYLQWGAGPERLLKLELQMRVGNRPATLQEVRGDDFYWVRRDVPPQPPSLWRVNLRQLRDSVGRPIGEAASDVLPQGAWIMLGGLPQLLASLEQNFAFDTPREDELQVGIVFRLARFATVEFLAGQVLQTRQQFKSERRAEGEGDLALSMTVDIVLLDGHFGTVTQHPLNHGGNLRRGAALDAAPCAADDSVHTVPP